MPDFQMSINLSYVQLAEDDIIPYMEDTLKELDLLPSHVVMELTETYLATADGETLKMLNDMKAVSYTHLRHGRCVKSTSFPG